MAKLIGDKGKGQGLSPRCPDIAFWSGDAVNTVIDRFQEAKKQSAAFKQYLPHCSKSKKNAPSGWPQPSSSSSYRQVQKRECRF